MLQTSLHAPPESDAHPERGSLRGCWHLPDRIEGLDHGHWSLYLGTGLWRVLRTLR